MPAVKGMDNPLCGCLAGFSRAGLLMSSPPLPGLDDLEGDFLPSTLPPVIDAHVHLFSEGLFRAIWRWFDTHGWPIRYQLLASEVVRFLLSRGVKHLVALHYAHKPSIAMGMNKFMSDLVSQYPQVTGLATVYPGEENIRVILEQAFDDGLRGVKLHCHVQAFAPDTAPLEEIYATCVEYGLPLVMHAGREPASPAYPIHPHSLCHVDRVEAVLRSYPRLRLCVPHLGVDEWQGYQRLLEQYDNLWLDTTMAAAGYFDFAYPIELLTMRPERVMYGTDFPNIPYAWDREVSHLARRCPEAVLEQLLGRTAADFFGIIPGQRQ
jgi:predicted TIM-barrel fold metal-dependent hydrolase